MSKIVWDEQGEHFYETGVDHGILFVYDPATKTYGAGVPWNGLTAVNESPSGAESNPQYADNIKYLDLTSAETFGATIEAFYYPDEFAECDGTKEIKPGIKIGQQARKMFAFAYRTKLGNDTMGNAYGYKLHIIYGAKAAPSENSHSTINDSPEASTFSWEISTTPVAVKGAEPTSHISIDSTKSDATLLQKIIDALEGTELEDSHLLLPDDIADLDAQG